MRLASHQVPTLARVRRVARLSLGETAGMLDSVRRMRVAPMVFGLAMLACSARDGTPTPVAQSDTPLPTVTQQADSTPRATVTPNADRTPPPPIAQRVVDLVAQHDIAGLVLAVSTQDRPCVVNAEGSPRCEGSDPEGTVYRVFPSASCQGFWTRNVQAVMEAVSRASAAPYAVARLGPPPDWAQKSGIPFGDYLVIFEPSSGSDRPEAVAVFLTDGSIVRTQVGCRRADQFLEPGSGESKPIVIWQ